MSPKRAEHWIFLATKRRRVQDFPCRYTFPFHELGTTLTRKVSFLSEKHVSWHLQQETVFCNPLLQLFIRRSFLGTTAKNREVFRACQKFIKRDEIFDEGNAIFAKTGEVVGSLKTRQLYTEKSTESCRGKIRDSSKKITARRLFEKEDERPSETINSYFTTRRQTSTISISQAKQLSRGGTNRDQRAVFSPWNNTALGRWRR